ncbi:MAG: histidine phosphatase family protein [Actinobacteria bacterium]|nr:histidine phosphatase family protein [Actinomycetota bacterium]MBI3686632.1 histidine phosphatase family protein [Actinomycetota bacterium]
MGETADGRLWLVRHGETEWSRLRRHTGRTDVPLTEHGQRQALALAPVLAAAKPVLVLVSPLQRARRTAELAGLVGPAAAGSLVRVDGNLSEWDYGKYEGLTTAEIREDHPGWRIWTGDPPGGETLAQVATRVDRVMARIDDALPTGNVVVVGHGHVGRVMAARWLGLPADAGRLLALGPATPCVLGTEHGARVVDRWNLPNPADEADEPE